jgi:superfamily I DNA/RNA helicase
MILPDQWQPADGMQLEPNALLAAKETQRHFAVTAGPGAGKTELLAQRADFLLRTQTCRRPRRILAISFKVDAARNLRERVRRRCSSTLAARLDSHTFHGFAKRLIDRFRPVLTGADALDEDYTVGKTRVARKQIDFDDIVPLALTILQASEVARNAVRQTYSHVFLDEFQDCTLTQFKLIHAAFHGTDAVLTAVGDTKQRIMGWAGALDGIFKKFADSFGAHPLYLYQNFRSQPRLRRMQNAMVRVMDPPAALRDDQITGDGGEIAVEHFANDTDEARRLADLIQGWINGGLPASQIAVLVARQPHLYAAPLFAELQQRGIAFRNEQKLQDLDSEPAACLMVDFLRVIATESNPDAHARLTRALVHTGDDEDREYLEHMGWRRFLDGARAELHALGAPPDVRALQCLIAAFLASFGRESLVALSADYEHGPRLDEVIAQMQAWLADTLGVVPNLTLALERFAEDDAVRVMTIHKSKGLEFDTVVVLGVDSQTFWSRNEDEARSSFFVAISRAKQRLLLTIAHQRPRPDGFDGVWREARPPHAEFVGYVGA